MFSTHEAEVSRTLLVRATAEHVEEEEKEPS